MGTHWKMDIRGSGMAIPTPIRAATFTQYIQQQAPWEIELLTHIMMEDDAFTVAWKLSFGIRGVSNGFVWIKVLGAFGWALTNDQGNHVAEGMGPAPGATPNLYQSKAYGLLS